MTEIVPVANGKSVTQLSLAELQDRLDARKTVDDSKTVTSSRKSRIEKAKGDFDEDPLNTLMSIQAHAQMLFDYFDATITDKSIPLSKAQVRTLSDEYLQLEKLKVKIAALETRYRDLVYKHLDETNPKVPGRPKGQTPGKVEAEGSGSRYIFERRGGNRADPDLDTKALRGSLLPHQVAKLYKTVRHDAVAAWTEEVFDVGAFGELVDSGEIDLDVVAAYLTPGKWRTPAFYKVLVEDDDNS